MIFVFQDITNWKKGTEHINGLAQRRTPQR